MSAQSKTKSLIRQDIAVDLLDKSQENPNKMKAREFDLLCDNLQQTGITDPVLVRPNPEAPGRFRIIGGHHRFDAAVYLGFTEVPCTIITDPEFGDEAERFQMVRMNMIRGKMSPEAFFALYEKVQAQYSDQVLQDLFGFAEEAEFKKMIDQSAAIIKDPVLKQQFKEAAKEVKTIDGLSKLLNEIFTKFGDTVPHGFMVFDYAGKRSIWIEASDKTIKAFDDGINRICREHSITADDFVGVLVQVIAQGVMPDVVAYLVERAPKVTLPKGMQALPTKKAMAEFAEVA